MPYYYRLQIRDYDNEAKRADKRFIAGRLRALRKALREHLHLYKTNQGQGTTFLRDSTQYLRLATWNIREFGAGEKFGPRLPEAHYYIAEILAHFDLIAIQEVHEDRRDLEKVMDILGPGWTYIATDVTGNRERMAYVFNTNKVWFRNIAGEVVLDKGDEISYPHEERLRFSEGLALELPEDTRLESPVLEKEHTYRRAGKDRLRSEVEIELPEQSTLQLPKGSRLVLPDRYVVTLTDDRRIVLPEGTQLGLPKDVMIKLPRNSIVGDTLQFARTPFLVSFQAGWLKINLCTVHIYYGEGRAGMKRRKEEIRQVTKFLAGRAAKENDFDADSFFILLGDFNIVGRSHATMAALKTNGFQVPEELESLPGTNVKKDKYYDQIAYWARDDGHPDSITRVEVSRAGVFDFFETVYRYQDEAIYKEKLGQAAGSKWDYAQWRTFQMSDHLPMWVELRIDFGDDYLKLIAP